MRSTSTGSHEKEDIQDGKDQEVRPCAGTPARSFTFCDTYQVAPSGLAWFWAFERLVLVEGKWETNPTTPKPQSKPPFSRHNYFTFNRCPWYHRKWSSYPPLQPTSASHVGGFTFGVPEKAQKGAFPQQPTNQPTNQASKQASKQASTHTHTQTNTNTHTHIRTYAHTHIRTYAHTHTLLLQVENAKAGDWPWRRRLWPAWFGMVWVGVWVGLGGLVNCWIACLPACWIACLLKMS